MSKLALIDHDHAALDHDLCVQHVPIPRQRVAIEQDDVGELSFLQRAQIIAHLDVRGGVGSHELDDVLHGKHQIETLQFMFQAGSWVIACIGAVAVDDTSIPRCARIYSLVPGFLASAVPVQNRLRPGFPISESRFVVFDKHAKDRNSETDRRQLLRAGSSDSLGILKAQPAKVRSMNKLWYTGLEGSHHGLWTHRVYLDPHARFL